MDLADFPAMPPPPGEVSDFNKPAPDAVVVSSLLLLTLTLSFLVVIIRLYVKCSTAMQKFTWDDGMSLKR